MLDPPPSSPLRYVVLRHEDVPEPHFDLMFESESGGDLATWRSPVWPLQDQTKLVHLGEHRRAYLEFEGPISGGRGQVRRVAAGNFRWVMKGRLLTIIQLLAPQSTWLIGSEPTGDGAVAVRA